MNRILKYRLGLVTELDIPCLWVIGDLSLNTVKRKFVAVATGSEVPHHYQYIGTAHCTYSVEHIFEVK